MNFRYILLLVALMVSNAIYAQDELKWKSEIDQLTAIDHSEIIGNQIILLTGSSSARMWKNIKEYFPGKPIINNGFGGSQMHELLYFIDELVLNYAPAKIFIYEGDNDISAGKSNETILATTKELVNKIKSSLPRAEIYFISPKPSLARWNLKEKYIALNHELNQYCATEENVVFIDVWNPMLNEDGNPIETIFISDGLHMNSQGYDIWAKVIGEFIK